MHSLEKIIQTMKTHARKLGKAAGGRREAATIIEVTWKPGGKYDVEFGASIGRRTQDGRIFEMGDSLSEVVQAAERRIKL